MFFFFKYIIELPFLSKQLNLFQKIVVNVTTDKDNKNQFSYEINILPLLQQTSNMYGVLT